MVRIRGGLLASTGATALCFARFASFGRVPEGEEPGGGGAPAAAVEDEDFFAEPGGDADAEAAAAAAAAAADDPEAAAAAAAAAAAEAPEWVKSFSAEKKEGELSNQEWLAKLGVKDLDGLAQIARDNQKALRESGRVKVPGEGATEAEVKAYREAVGAPAEAKGYEVGLPQGADGFELDLGVLEPMREIALKHNIPTAAFKEMGELLLKGQLDGFQGELAQHGTDKAAKLKEWGVEAEQGKAEFKRGQQFLGLKVGDIQRMQTGFGVGPTMDLLRMVGQRAGEDFFAGNTGNAAAARFGVTDAESAQKAIDAMTGDKDTAAKLKAKDPITVARYNGLIDAKAGFLERASRGR